jgi:esterase/lipase superfamily enzyme
MTGEQLTQAIAVEWERIVAAIGPALGEFETALTTLLRELDQRPNHRPTIDAIVALFEEHSSAREILRQGLSHVGAQVSKGGETTRIFDEKVRYTTVPLFFGTSRAPSGSFDPTRYFGANRANNSFGILNVSIPDDHRMGNLEKPRWFKLQFHADPEKHVLLLKVEPLELPQFIERGRSAIGQLGRKDILVFIHGYNVTFEDAARRAAQVAYDLHFEGLPALYSWPSEGSFTKYLIDANNVTWAEPHFRDFLRIVREELGADKVHVIAHSMGTRLLANTVVALSSGATAGSARLQQLVFAAPDIDSDTFRDLSAAFGDKAERFTLYASSGDRALAASQRFQKYARAGQSGLDLVIVSTVDTIDASSVDTEFLGHSYFGDADSVLSDLFYLIRNGASPGNRARLKRQQRYGETYWEFSR